MFQACGEREVSLEDVENWLNDSDTDLGHQGRTIAEIADSMTKEPLEDNSNSGSEEEVVTRPKMVYVH